MFIVLGADNLDGIQSWVIGIYKSKAEANMGMLESLARDLQYDLTEDSETSIQEIVNRLQEGDDLGLDIDINEGDDCRYYKQSGQGGEIYYSIFEKNDLP